MKTKDVSYKKTSLKVSKLTSKKTYYVRVRTYKKVMVTVNGSKKTYCIYSKWSAAKKITVK